jgi:hypothetical protein
MGHLLDALSIAYDALGFPQATGHDEVFGLLVLARIVDPTSKQDSLRVLGEAGAPAPSYPTLNRRLPVWAEESLRQGLSGACAAHARLGPASLVLYDVSTLYFEADKGDGFREPWITAISDITPLVRRVHLGTADAELPVEEVYLLPDQICTRIGASPALPGQPATLR